MYTDDEDRLPQALIDELKGAERNTRVLTSKVDRQIEAASTSHFAARKRPRWPSRPAWAAVAASLLIAMFIVRPQLQAPEMADTAFGTAASPDQLDIVDVFALARSEDSRPQSELDALAFSIVSLAPENGS
jgi:hypothetical protein